MNSILLKMKNQYRRTYMYSCWVAICLSVRKFKVQQAERISSSNMTNAGLYLNLSMQKQKMTAKKNSEKRLNR